MKSRMALFLVSALLLINGIPAWADTIASPEPAFDNPRKLVIQLNTGDVKQQEAVFNNVSNLLKFYENNVRMAVVVFGQGIDVVLKGSAFNERIQSLKAYDVEFIACGNTLKVRQKTKDDLLPGVGYATAGLAEIAERQLSGWVYLRP
ncbi:MAG: DsrE family protein [Nitrospinae bacterium]|nr:DsrE family protein [Nitrospinota bacterium]